MPAFISLLCCCSYHTTRFLHVAHMHVFLLTPSSLPSPAAAARYTFLLLMSVNQATPNSVLQLQMTNHMKSNHALPRLLPLPPLRSPVPADSDESDESDRGEVETHGNAPWSFAAAGGAGQGTGCACCCRCCWWKALGGGCCCCWRCCWSSARICLRARRIWEKVGRRTWSSCQHAYVFCMCVYVGVAWW